MHFLLLFLAARPLTSCPLVPDVGVKARKESAFASLSFFLRSRGVSSYEEIRPNCLGPRGPPPPAREGKSALNFLLGKTDFSQSGCRLQNEGLPPSLLTQKVTENVPEKNPSAHKKKKRQAGES